MKRICRLLLFCSFISGIPHSPAMAGKPWFASVYAGQQSRTALLDIVRLDTDFDSPLIYVVSVGKEIGTLWEKVGMELEGQAAVHVGKQDHSEFNAVFTLRWLPFPWDQYLDTSIALGNGISYASAEPEIEIIDSDDHETSQWLYYMLVEVALGTPAFPRWDLFIRIHHRSSVYGAISNLRAGSNFVGAGLRYRFY